TPFTYCAPESLLTTKFAAFAGPTSASAVQRNSTSAPFFWVKGSARISIPSPQMPMQSLVQSPAITRLLLILLEERAGNPATTPSHCEPFQSQEGKVATSAICIHL